MKKLLAFILAAIFAVTPLLGCGAPNDGDTPSTTEPEVSGDPEGDLPPLYAGEEPQRPEYIINPFMIPDVYLTLLTENGSFELDGAEIRINDYRFPTKETPINNQYVKFYTLDMDGDGEYELILSDSIEGDELLLHEDGGKIKGYSFSGDEMYGIHLNGSFGRYGDNLYSNVRLKFTENGIEYVELARRESVFEGEDKYFVGGEEVTEDEYDDYVYGVPYAVYYPLNAYLESLGADLEALIDIFAGRYNCFYNFINENEGYFFWFYDSMLRFVLKTEDGGKSWKYEELWNVPDISWHEYIICAKMVNEDVGLISSQSRADSNFSNCTYITVNGGKAWEQVVFTPDKYYAKGESNEKETYNELEAYDLRYEDGEWIICCRGNGVTYEIGKVYVEYSSPDLKKWTYCEKSRINTESFKDYSDILEAMNDMLHGKAKEDVDVSDNEYDKEILDAIDHSVNSPSSDKPLCYVEKDVDGNGTRELLILSFRGTLLSLFTMTEKGPRAVCGNLVSLGTDYDPVCIIGNDGKLYLSSYGWGETSNYMVCTISPGGDHLDIECGLWVYDYSDNSDSSYYGFSNNMMYGITRDEYNRIYSEYGFAEIFNSEKNYNNIERLDLEPSYFPGMTPQGK
ncbi:MAG: hypothetical protein IJX46_09935 [Clostridia bacterium]|nr:hypothetical protein [Clostridia bacterium]